MTTEETIAAWDRILETEKPNPVIILNREMAEALQEALAEQAELISQQKELLNKILDYANMNTSDENTGQTGFEAGMSHVADYVLRAAAGSRLAQEGNL